MNAETIALEFVDTAKRITDINEMVECIHRVGCKFGMSCFLSGVLPGPGEPGYSHVLLNGWPPGWFERYMERDYIHKDAVISTLGKTLNPFRWSQCINSNDDDPTALKIFNEAREFHLKDGFAVPIYSFSGVQSGISFGTDKYELGPKDEMALLIIGIYAQNRARELLGGTEKHAVQKIMNLSPRELECLRWIAVGKTNWEISQILSLSQRTIDMYVASMCRKLDVVGRTHAVALACQAQII